jgi:hypothetical protein
MPLGHVGQTGPSDEFWSDSMTDPMTQGHYIVYSSKNLQQKR